MKRVVLKRREPLVECATIDPDDRRGRVESCGAMIPYAPKKPCPNCGKRQIRATAPNPPEGALVIDEDAVIIDEDSGVVVAVQSLGETQLASEIGQHLRHIKWQGHADLQGHSGPVRLSGIAVTNSTFGYAQPVPLRRRWACTRCRIHTDFPECAAAIDRFVHTAERKFRQMAPDVYRETAEAVLALVPEAWRIKGTPWTSGVINNTAALPYHKDSGNIPGSWSAMIACRSGIGGGLLHLADYDAYLAVPHGSISIFDGQSVLHGVTPFHVTSHDAWRYTLVAYAKSGMKTCAPNPADEPLRAQLRATQAEEARVRKKSGA